MNMDLYWVVYILLLIGLSNAYTTEINMEYECPSYSVYNPNEDRSYELIWSGGEIKSGCKLQFLGRGNDLLDKYKVCIEAVEYTVEDCNVKLQFYNGYSIIPRNTYSCYDSPPKTCIGVDERLGVQLSTDSYSFKQYYENSHFRLEITASKTYNYTRGIGTIVLAVVSSIVLLVIAVIIIIVVICYRRRNARNTMGYVYNPRSQTVTTTATTVTTNNQSPPPYSVYTQNGNQQVTYPYTVQQNMQHNMPPQAAQQQLPTYDTQQQASMGAKNVYI